MKKNKLFIASILFIYLLIIYRFWFVNTQIIGGDWPYFYQENIRDFGYLPPSWSSVQGNGFGGPVLVYALDSYLYFTGWLFSNVLLLPWSIVYKVVWFGMFIVLGFFSIYYFLKEHLPTVPVVFRSIGIFIYLTNTYILLVVGGGQMGVALGYAVVPLVFTTFVKVLRGIHVNKNKLLLSLYAGLLFALQVLFDIRIAYITMVAVFFYIITCLFFYSNIDKITFCLKSFLYAIIIPLFITGIVHIFWILPFIFTGQSTVTQLGSGYTSINAVRFFSFAKFENSFGLLHPNWPENIFGKVAFMKPEFLLLPIIAFSNLLFVNFKSKKNSQKLDVSTILYFSFLALIGIFLAKGSNDPFGEIYINMFNIIPGFIMFRDPTKWYTLIALSFSLLIPCSIWQLYQFLSSKNTSVIFKFQNIFLLLFIGYLLFLNHPALLGNLSGTFSKNTVPEEYTQLKDNLVKNDQFSRTLWIPRVQRFAYTSQNHPAVEASFLFQTKNEQDLIKKLQEKNTERELQDLSIRYVIIPYDSEKEIFLKDRTYNSIEREAYQKQLDSISWLKKLENFRDLDVYEIKNIKGRLWFKEDSVLSYEKVSGTHYKIHTSSGNKKTLIFNEAYSPYWKIAIGNHEIVSHQYKNINSFVVPPRIQDTDMVLYYSLERYYVIGRYISVISLLSLIILGIVLKRRYR